MKKLLSLLVCLTLCALASVAAGAVSTFRLTVPEGYTLARIGMLLEEHGVCTAEAFIAASQSGDYSAVSPLIAAQPPEEGRCFKLEGYLFPDTYEFYVGESPDTILRTLLANAEKKLTPELRQAIAGSGYTADEILTLASIIEKEASNPKDMPGISAVLHNRLDQKMRLQCDVTIKYVEGAVKPFITGDVNRYNGHYNTYKCPALPAGPICNPGLHAIEAALSPADSDALYFVTDRHNRYYFADTWEEHVENIEAIREQDGDTEGEQAAPAPSKRPKLTIQGSAK